MKPSSSYGSRYNKGQNRHRDVKSRSKFSYYSKIDEDIASKYDFDDDEFDKPMSAERNQRFRNADFTYPTKRNNINNQLINRHLNRRENVYLKATASGSGRREMIYKIIVKDASKSGKDHVLKLLVDSVDRFFPITPHMNNSNLEFHIVNQDVADALRSLSRRISDKNNPNVKYPIIVTKDIAPYETLNLETRHLIEEVVRERYNASSKSIDLSDFGSHKAFTERQLRCHLFNNAIMVAISDYIGEDFSEIKGISLKNNRLRSLDYVSNLIYTAPNIIELDLSSNVIPRIEELERISAWHIERIHLENNEFTAKYPNASLYTRLLLYLSAIHHYFPRVTYLDGTFVNPDSLRILAETNATLSDLPRYKPGYCSNEASKKLAEAFLSEYFDLYDGMDGEQTRKRLMNAYDENSTFTYSVHILQDTLYVQRGDSDIYKSYIRSSHNIMSETRWAQYREKIIYKGSMDIAVALSKLPLTMHIRSSFVIDFNLITNNIMVFTVQGVFKDGSNAFSTDSAECKFFIRNFVVVPKQDNTMAIISDMLMITPISINRLGRFNTLLKKAKEIEAESMKSQTITISAPPPTPQLRSSISTLQNHLAEEDSHNQMVRKFNEFSGMKLEWSRKCLEDCSWNFEQAAEAFNTIRSRIPSEAFI